MRFWIRARTTLWILTALVGPASGADNRQSVGFAFDNDVFLGTDQLYTNGFHLGYISRYLDHFAEGPTPRVIGDLIEAIPAFGRAGDQRFVCYNVSQLMVTPEDTKRADPDPNDLPYSGYLLARNTFVAQRAQSLDACDLLVGIVGPHSYAQKTQDFVHDALGNERAAGWDHQLHDELILGVSYEHRSRLYQAGWTDALASVNAQLGNFATMAGVATSWRCGWNLGDDYWMPPPFATDDAIGLRPWSRAAGPRFVAVLSLTASLTAIGRFEPFDGNLFGDSPSVAHDPWACEGYANVLLWLDRVGILFSVGAIRLPYSTPDGRLWDRYGRIAFGFDF